MPKKIPELGNLISEARTKLRMTPKKLADRSYCTLDYIYKIERGDVPNIRTLKIIFDSLGLQSEFEKWQVVLDNLKWE